MFLICILKYIYKSVSYCLNPKFTKLHLKKDNSCMSWINEAEIFCWYSTCFFIAVKWITVKWIYFDFIGNHHFKKDQIRSLMEGWGFFSSADFYKNIWC